MKRKIPRLLTLALPLLAVCGCTSGEPQTAELTVFAAASMTETLEELKPVFEKSHPGVTVVYNFDSSGTLKTQIEEGAVCDAFISAGQKQMDELDAGAGPEANPDGLDFILKDSRINLLENRVVLCGGRRPAVHGKQRRSGRAVHPENPGLFRIGRNGPCKRREHNLWLQRQRGYNPNLGGQRGRGRNLLYRRVQRGADPGRFRSAGNVRTDHLSRRRDEGFRAARAGAGISELSDFQQVYGGLQSRGLLPGGVKGDG